MSSLSASWRSRNPGHTKPNVKQCYFISIQFVIFRQSNHKDGIQRTIFITMAGTLFIKYHNLDGIHFLFFSLQKLV